MQQEPVKEINIEVKEPTVESYISQAIHTMETDARKTVAKFFEQPSFLESVDLEDAPIMYAMVYGQYAESKSRFGGYLQGHLDEETTPDYEDCREHLRNSFTTYMNAIAEAQYYMAVMERLNRTRRKDISVDNIPF